MGYFNLPSEKLPEIFKKCSLEMSDENRERLEQCFHSQYCALCGSQRCEQTGEWLNGCHKWKEFIRTLDMYS